MTPAEIQKLRELLAAATPGPWTAGDNDWEIDAVSFTEHDDDCVEDCAAILTNVVENGGEFVV